MARKIIFADDKRFTAACEVRCLVETILKESQVSVASLQSLSNQLVRFKGNTGFKEYIVSHVLGVIGGSCHRCYGQQYRSQECLAAVLAVVIDRKIVGKLSDDVSEQISSILMWKLRPQQYRSIWKVVVGYLAELGGDENQRRLEDFRSTIQQADYDDIPSINGAPPVLATELKQQDCMYVMRRLRTRFQPTEARHQKSITICDTCSV